MSSIFLFPDFLDKSVHFKLMGPSKETCLEWGRLDEDFLFFPFSKTTTALVESRTPLINCIACIRHTGEDILREQATDRRTRFSWGQNIRLSRWSRALAPVRVHIGAINEAPTIQYTFVLDIAHNPHSFITTNPHCPHFLIASNCNSHCRDSSSDKLEVVDTSVRRTAKARVALNHCNLRRSRLISQP